MRRILLSPEKLGYKTEAEMLCNLVANGHTPLSIQKFLIKQGINIGYSTVVRKILEAKRKLNNKGGEKITKKSEITNN